MRPLIGITSGETKNKEYPFAPTVHGQAFTYIDAVIHAGGTPVLLPITDELSVLDELSERIDGLLLSGGNDLDPSRYGEKPYKSTFDFSTFRDRNEWYLLDKLLPTKKPILSICRGMQLINVYSGGSLYQEINKDVPSAQEHDEKKMERFLEYVAHKVRLDSKSKLYGIIKKDELMVNTYHHQAIKKLGRDFKVCAKADDGIIEAIETTTDRFLIGVQAHPESLESSSVPDWQKLFKAFVEAC